MDRDPPPEMEWDHDEEDQGAEMDEDEMGVSNEEREGIRNPSLVSLIQDVKGNREETFISIEEKEELVNSVDRGQSGG